MTNTALTQSHNIIPMYKLDLLQINPKDRVLFADGQVARAKKVEFDKIGDYFYIDISFDKKVSGFKDAKSKCSNQIYYRDGRHIEDNKGNANNIIAVIKSKKELKLTEKYAHYSKEELMSQVDILLGMKRAYTV